MYMEGGGKILRDEITSEQVYFLTRGTLLMFEPDEDVDSGTSHILTGVLEPGAEFELSTAIRRKPMQCEYKAANVCHVWWIGTDDFQNKFQDHPDIIDCLHKRANEFDITFHKVTTSEIICR